MNSIKALSLLLMTPVLTFAAPSLHGKWVSDCYKDADSYLKYQIEFKPDGRKSGKMFSSVLTYIDSDQKCETTPIHGSDDEITIDTYDLSSEDTNSVVVIQHITNPVSIESKNKLSFSSKTSFRLQVFSSILTMEGKKMEVPAAEIGNFPVLTYTKQK